MVKNPPVMQETWVQSLGQEDPLEAGMVTHSSILAWKIPYTHLLISWLQSPSAVILEPIKIKSATVSTVSRSISHEVMGQDAMI